MNEWFVRHAHCNTFMCGAFAMRLTCVLFWLAAVHLVGYFYLSLGCRSYSLRRFTSRLDVVHFAIYVWFRRVSGLGFRVWLT